MATLYIEEYADLLEDVAGAQMQTPGDLVATQKLTIGASSAASASFNERTVYLFIVSDAVCQYELGDSPTADGDSRFLPPFLFRCVSVENKDKIAVIDQQ